MCVLRVQESDASSELLRASFPPTHLMGTRCVMGKLELPSPIPRPKRSCHNLPLGVYFVFPSITG